MQAFGIIGNYFYTHQNLVMEDYLYKLREIDWKRNAFQWKLRVIRTDGRIMTSNKAIDLMAVEIKKKIGLDLSEEEQIKEQKFINSINI